MPIVRERTAHQSGQSSCFAEVEFDIAFGDEPGPTTFEQAADAEVTQGDWYLASVRVGIDPPMRRLFLPPIKPRQCRASAAHGDLDCRFNRIYEVLRAGGRFDFAAQDAREFHGRAVQRCRG